MRIPVNILLSRNPGRSGTKKLRYLKVTNKIDQNVNEKIIFNRGYIRTSSKIAYKLLRQPTSILEFYNIFL